MKYSSFSDNWSSYTSTSMDTSRTLASNLTSYSNLLRSVSERNGIKINSKESD